jgi:hypothetical protein
MQCKTITQKQYKALNANKKTDTNTFINGLLVINIVKCLPTLTFLNAADVRRFLYRESR